MSDEKKLKVFVCYTAMETYYLPLEAKSYLSIEIRTWKERDSIAAYICEHNCQADKKSSDDWQIVGYEECAEVTERGKI
jgi:hypothetical protein